MRLPKQLLSKASVLALTAFIAGPTSCDYFGVVTVPASDTGEPTGYAGIYNASTGVYEQLVFDEGSFAVNTPYSVVKYAFASGIDAGGVKSISTDYQLRWKCCTVSLACTSGYEASTLTESQTGSTGSQVSDGIWVARAFRPSDVLAQKCGASAGPEDRVQLSWKTTVKDFKGNTGYANFSHVRYNW